MNVTVSPSRTYVAMCANTNFNGYYFRRFHLPEGYANNSDQAAWHFLNRLDGTACMPEGVCISFETYANIKDVDYNINNGPTVEENVKKILIGVDASIGVGSTSAKQDEEGVYLITWAESTESSAHFIKRRISIVELEDPCNVPVFIHSFLLSYLDYQRRPR